MDALGFTIWGDLYATLGIQMNLLSMVMEP